MALAVLADGSRLSFRAVSVVSKSANACKDMRGLVPGPQPQVLSKLTLAQFGTPMMHTDHH